jgi:hypothetical protein
MEDAAPVRVLDRARNGRHEPGDLLGRGWGTSGHPGIQVLTFDQIHAKERVPIAFPDVMDANDVRMVKTRRRLGFNGETPQQRGRRHVKITDELQRHCASVAQAPGFIHDTHPARTDLPSQEIFAELSLRGVAARIGRWQFILFSQRHADQATRTLAGNRIDQRR